MTSLNYKKGVVKCYSRQSDNLNRPIPVSGKRYFFRYLFPNGFDKFKKVVMGRK
jgi:hypothetical protein